MGVKLAFKKRRSDSGKARQKRSRETCGRERVKSAGDFTLQKDKALLNRKGRKFNPPVRSNQNAALNR